MTHELTKKVLRMGATTHWFLGIGTLGLFPILWFAWARAHLDGLVQGKRIQLWGPVTAYLCWLLGWLCVALALHPQDATGFDLMRAFGMEVRTMLAMGAALVLAGKAVVAVMSYRALTILRDYYGPRLSSVVPVSWNMLLSLGSAYVQYSLNLMAELYALEMQRRSAVRRAMAQRCVGR